MSLEQAQYYNKLRQCYLNERRIKFIIDRLQSYNLSSGSIILEMGSGTGWLLLRLSSIFPQFKFIGVEPDKDFLSFAQKQELPSNVTFFEGYAESFDMTGVKNVGLVLTNDVLHHVNSTIEHVIQNIIAKADINKCQWLIIEPNCFNPVVFWRHRYLWRQYGEDIFNPFRFLKLSGGYGWVLKRMGFLFLIPSSYKTAPGWLSFMESFLEWIPLLAGGIFLELTFIKNTCHK